MIKRFLKSVRQKPKSYRDNIAFVASGVITAVIFAGWLYNTPTRLAAIEERHKQPEERDTSPGFSRLFSGISNQVANIKESIVTKEEDETVVSELDAIDFEVVVPDTNSTTSGSFASSSKYSWSTPDNAEVTKESEGETESNTTTGREVLITTTESSSSTASEPSATSQ